MRSMKKYLFLTIVFISCSRTDKPEMMPSDETDEMVSKLQEIYENAQERFWTFQDVLGKSKTFLGNSNNFL